MDLLYSGGRQLGDGQSFRTPSTKKTVEKTVETLTAHHDLPFVCSPQIARQMNGLMDRDMVRVDPLTDRVGDE